MWYRDADYAHAQKVWNQLNIQTLGQYSDIYLQTDVCLLVDIFETFRNTCLEYYKLDPCHYYTTPGLSWDSMLKLTGVELDLITDIEMLLLVEKGVRGKMV